MGFSSQLYQDQLDEEELIEQLSTIHYDISDERAKGILRQIQAQGIRSLSRKQQYIYDKFVEPIRSDRFKKCLVCCQFVDAEYAFQINDHGEYMCDFCWSNIMRE